MPSQSSVLYIGGTGRSGSTVLARLLGQVPGIVAAGELRYALRRGVIANQLCGCGKPFHDCEFWTEVFARVLGGMDVARAEHLLRIGRHVDRIRYAPQLVSPRLRSAGFRAAWSEYEAFFATLYDVVADVSGARVVIDSSKDPTHAFVLHAMESIDLSLLHLVRDSRAVAFSLMRKKVRPEIHWRVEYMRQRPPVRAALIWSEYHLLFDVLSRLDGQQHRRLRYEDFAATPDACVADVARWVGCDAAAASTQPAFVHDISGNPVRFVEGPLVVAEDDDWRREMSTRDRRTVSVLTYPLLRRYGYR